jgi:hypothetical protein
MSDLSEGDYQKIQATVKAWLQGAEDRVTALNSLKKFLHVQQTWTQGETDAWYDKQSGGNN